MDKRFFVPSWTSSSPDLCRCTLPTTLPPPAGKIRSSSIRSVRSSVCPSSQQVNDFFPSLSFLSFQAPPKGTDPRQQKHTTWTKSSSSKEGRKELSEELLLFLCVWTFCVYGRTNLFCCCGVVWCGGAGVS